MMWHIGSSGWGRTGHSQHWNTLHSCRWRLRSWSLSLWQNIQEHRPQSICTGIQSISACRSPGKVNRRRDLIMRKTNYGQLQLLSSINLAKNGFKLTDLQENYTITLSRSQMSSFSSFCTEIYTFKIRCSRVGQQVLKKSKVHVSIYTVNLINSFLEFG